MTSSEKGDDSSQESSEQSTSEESSSEESSDASSSSEFESSEEDSSDGDSEIEGESQPQSVTPVAMWSETIEASRDETSKESRNSESEGEALLQQAVPEAMEGAANESSSEDSIDSGSIRESKPHVVAPTTLKRAVSETDPSKDSSHTENEEEMQRQSTRKRAATPFYKTPHAKRVRHQTPVSSPQKRPISTVEPASMVIPSATCKTETPVPPPPQRRRTSLVKPTSAATPLPNSKAPTLVPSPRGSTISRVEPMSAVIPLPKPKALAAATVPQKRRSSTRSATPTRIWNITVTPTDESISENRQLAPDVALPTKVRKESPILPPAKKSAAPTQKSVPYISLSAKLQENSPKFPRAQLKLSLPNKIQPTATHMAGPIETRRARSPIRPPLKPFTSSVQNIRKAVQAAFTQPTQATPATKPTPSKSKADIQPSSAAQSLSTKPRVEAPRRHPQSNTSRSTVQKEKQFDPAVAARSAEAVPQAKVSTTKKLKRSTTTAPCPSSQQANEGHLSLAGNVSRKSDSAARALSAKPELQVPSTQDYVKKKPLQSQHPQAIREGRRTSVTDKSTPTLTPPEFSSPSSSPSSSSSLIPKTPSPAPSAAPLLDSLVRTPVDQPARTAISSPKEVEPILEWSEQPPVILGRDSRVSQIMPKVVVRGATAAGLIPSSTSEQMDHALTDSNLRLIITVTNDPDNHNLLKFMQACLPQTPFFCGAFIRNKHVIASFAKSEWRAFAMRTFNSSVMVEGAPCVQVKCGIDGLCNTAYERTCLIVCDAKMIPSREKLQRAICSLISDGDMSVDYGLWTHIELLHAVRVLEFVRTQESIRREIRVGILMVFPTEFCWQECFEELDIDGIKLKVEVLKEEAGCGSCGRRGHRMRNCDHYVKSYRNTYTREWTTEHLELTDVV